MIFAVQYLEDSPYVQRITPDEGRERLRDALARLPISMLVLGWNVPDPLLDVCAEEAAQAGAQVLRWHLLLSGDGAFVPRPEWQVMGLDGEPVPGYMDMPEFTFVCPNRPAAREAVLAHLHEAIHDGLYEGVFLDRMRYPSPAEAPDRFLGCFCEDCRRLAADSGLDLEEARHRIQTLLETPEGARAYVRVLLDPLASTAHDANLAHLRAFLDFRQKSVTRFIRQACDVIRDEGLMVGLDCFSPALTYLVGQDLKTLTPHSDWIKVMTYGHTFAPAGIPFELLGLADWLLERGFSDGAALEILAHGVRLPLPSTRSGLHERGLAPEALAAEVNRALDVVNCKLLAGIELVDHEVTRLDPEQIAADLQAFHAAGADGLVLSWDLWHIPTDWLDLVGSRFMD
ncbi:MAG TPA: hypothetical protein ENN19_18870 [Chloroflexi bacterium]|nr:hypothetical protein [Chloroflexota bacterium]